MPVIQQAGQQRQDLIARIFAETGVKDLMRGIKYMLSKYSTRPMTIRLRNKWVEVNPRDWKERNDLTINVGLGTGSKMERASQLMMLVGLQRELDAAHIWLEQIKDIVPKAKRILLQDNHFFRRLKDKMIREVWLEDVSAIQPDALLRLKEFGWQSMKEYLWKDVLLFIHGDDSPGSSASPVNRARVVANANGLSVCRFHSHGTGFEVHKHAFQHIAAIQLGTFESITDAGYIKHPYLSNWSNSFGLFYLSKKTKEFFFVPAYFVNGKCIINNKVYA